MNDSFTSGDFGDIDANGVPSYANTQGIEITIIDNDADGIVDAVLQNISVFGQVTKITKDNKVTVKTDGYLAGLCAAGKSINPAVTANSLVPANKELDKEVVAYEDIATDDYVNATKVDETWYLTKAESVTGDLESFENDAEDKDKAKLKTMTVDGETYKVTKVGETYTASLKKPEDVGVRSALTEEVTIYFDAFGYIVAGTTKAASSWLFVANAAVNNTASSKNGGALTAYVYFEDGTSGSYVVDKVTSAGVVYENFSDTYPQSIIGRLLKYSMTSSGHLVLESAEEVGTDTLSKQSEMVVADGTKGIVYDRDRSKLTVQTVYDSYRTSDVVKYVTMDTPVFFVTLKKNASNNLIVDKVNVYDEKTAPSMFYKTTAGGNKLWNNTNSDFEAGVTYVSAAKSTYNLDAVLFTSETAVGSDWLYVIEYTKSVDGGRFYRAIVDGEVVEIETTDNYGYARTAKTAYSFSMDGDRYVLDTAAYNANLVAVGQVSLVDSKSIIVKDSGTGTEKKITNSTITALIDGEDSIVDAKVSVGDLVYMIYNESKEAEAIFILSEYDEAAAGIAYMGQYVKEGATADKLIVGKQHGSELAKTGALDYLKKLIGVNGEAKWMKKASKPTVASDAWSAVANDLADADLKTTVEGAADDVVYLAVKADALADTVKGSTDTTKADTGYVLYEITIETAAPDAPAPAVTLAAGTLTTVGGTTALKAGETVKATASTFTATTADNVKFNVAASNSETVGDIKVTVNGGSETTISSGDAVTLVKGENTVVITVGSSKTNCKTVDYTYTVVITVS